MNILFVTPSFMPALNYGGTTISIYEVCRSLSVKNSILVLATNLNGDIKLDITPDALNEIDGIDVIYHDIKWLKKMFCSFRFLKNIFLEIPKCDVVHIQSVFFIPAIFSAILCKALKKPFYVSTRGAVGEVVIAGKNSIAKKFWLRVLAWPLFIWSEGLHVTSRWESETLCDLGFDNDKHHIISNGVRVPKKELKNIKNKFFFPNKYILYVGRISPEKGLDILLQAFKKSNVECDLIIAGDDSTPYGYKIRELAKKLEIGDKVNFIGQVEESKWSIFKGASCLLLTSVSENFGNVVLESLAVGTPAIVTSGVGAAEVVDAYESGYVVKRSISNIAEAIKKIIDNPHESARLGENGRLVVNKIFSWDKIADEYLKMYKKGIVKNRSART